MEPSPSTLKTHYFSVTIFINPFISTMGMMAFLAVVTLIGHCNCWSLSAATPIVWRLGQRPEDQLMLQGVVGPESIAFDGAGEGPYTGVSDGSVIKWDRQTGQWTEFAMTLPHSKMRECNGTKDPSMEAQCGRTLGLQFHKGTGSLYMADSSLGLLTIGPQGGIATSLATAAEGVKFSFTNGLDIDQDTGIVYFTDSSTRFHRWDFVEVVLQQDMTGRLLKYDPATGAVEVMLRGLFFPNGLAISGDNSFLLIVESGHCRVLKVWLKGPNAGASEVFSMVPGFPDNIKRTPRGDYWVALNTGFSYIWPPPNAMVIEEVVAVRIGADGQVVEVVGNEVGVPMKEAISEIEEREGRMWIGSVSKPYVGIYKV